MKFGYFATVEEKKRMMNRQENLDVEFAYMPYSKLNHPALGVSILKKCLIANNIDSQVSYYLFDFAEVIGTVAYNRLVNSSTTALAGDWTFSRSAFGADFHSEKNQNFGKYPQYNETLEIISLTAEQWIENLADKISISPPKIVVCSSMFQQNVASLAILKAIKRRCPEVFTIMGGPNTEGVLGLGLLRRAPWLDYVCAGEGEETLPQLCRLLLDKEFTKQKPIGVLSQKDIIKYEGQYQATLLRPTLERMEQSPSPCFDDYFDALKESKHNIKPGLLLESSRGCWWGQRSQCTFCGLNGEGMAYRAQEPTRMAERVHEITEKYQINRIEFVDNIIAKNYFEDFLPLISDQNLSMFYETKADFTEADAKRFFESGTRWIQPGIESLSDPVLMLMKKGTSAAVNIECLRLCREYGILPAWSILCGFPEEKEEWYEETNALLPKLFHFRPPNGLISIRFDRFSPYHDNPEKWGLELEPFDSYKYVYPSYQDQYSDIAYFFKKRGCPDEESSPVVEKNNNQFKISKNILKEWKEIWNSRQSKGLEQPQLTLLHDSRWHIYDDRRPGIEASDIDISESMVHLLTYCRTRRRRTSIEKLTKKFPYLYSDKDIVEELLQKATKNGWIIDIGGNLICVVQVKNHQQLPPDNFPGGLMTGITKADQQRLVNPFKHTLLSQEYNYSQKKKYHY